MLLLTGTALATSTAISAPSDVIIYAFDQNPGRSDDGNEWVTIHNPANESVDMGNWTFESTHGTTAIDWIAEGTTLYPGAYCTYTPHYGWLDNSEEAIILRKAKGEEVGKTIQYNCHNLVLIGSSSTPIIILGILVSIKNHPFFNRVMTYLAGLFLWRQYKVGS